MFIMEEQMETYDKLKISQGQQISFKRLLSPLEKIEARAYSTDAKRAIGLDNLANDSRFLIFPKE